MSKNKPRIQSSIFFLKQLLIIIIVSCNYNLIAQSSLKHHFKFNNNAIDSIGGIIGTVNGATLTTDEFGVNNNAYSFNGINDYIEITDPVLNYPEYTYSICLMPASIPASGTNKSFFGIGNATADQYFYLANNQVITGTPLHNGFECSSYFSPFVYPPDYVSSSVLPSINTWYHLVYTRDLNNLKLYINGALIDTEPVESPVVNYGAPNPIQGFVGSRDGFSSFFNGKIEDIKIFNKALSASEISTLSCHDTMNKTDTIISDTSIHCRINIPTAFSPNGDNHNDYFRTFVNCPVDYFNIKIFNRWGENIFESNDINEFWDGKYKFIEQPLDVYTWMIHLKFTDKSSSNTEKGNVTLIR